MKSVIFGALLVFFVHVGVHYWGHIQVMNLPAMIYRGEPLLTANDGYFHLDIAERLVHPDPYRPLAGDAGVSLLSRMTALAHELSSVPLRTLAYLSSPVLAASVLFVLLFIGVVVFGRTEAGVIAALIQAASPYWYLRTRVGYFDTDPLIPFFLLGALACVSCFARDTKRSRWWWLGACCAFCAGAGLWWPQAWWLTAAMALAGYCATVLAPSKRGEQRVKILLLGFGAVLLLLTALNLQRLLPNFLAMPLSSLRAYVWLVFAGEEQGGLPRAHVGELMPIATLSLMKFINGSYAGLAAGLAGLAFLFARPYRLVFLPFVPMLILGLLTVVAARFSIFLLPLYALGVGWLCSELQRFRFMIDLAPNTLVRKVMAALVALAVIVPSGAVTVRLPTAPPFDARQASFAEQLGTATEPGTMLWSSWSDGYFLNYFAKRAVRAHGGTLAPEELYIAEAPFCMADPCLAANWIRFFTARGFEGTARTEQALGLNRLQALFLMRELLESPARAAVLLRQRGQQDIDVWLEHLFPDVKAAVFLDRAMIETASNWFTRGTWDFKTGRGAINETVWIEPQRISLESQAQGLQLNGVPLPVSQLIRITDKEAQIEDITTARGGGAVVEFLGRGIPRLWIGPRFLNSLYAKLFIAPPGATPGFKKIFGVPQDAGAWIVSNCASGDGSG